MSCALVEQQALVFFHGLTSECKLVDPWLSEFSKFTPILWPKYVSFNVFYRLSTISTEQLRFLSYSFIQKRKSQRVAPLMIETTTMIIMMAVLILMKMVRKTTMKIMIIILILMTMIRRITVTISPTILTMIRTIWTVAEKIIMTILILLGMRPTMTVTTDAVTRRMTVNGPQVGRCYPVRRILLNHWKNHGCRLSTERHRRWCQLKKRATASSNQYIIADWSPPSWLASLA